MSLPLSPATKYASAAYPPIDAQIKGHSLRVTISGADRLAALLGLIEGAKESLRLFFYIFEDDAIGTRIREALIDAINRGVKVHLLVDGFGTGDRDDSFYQPLVDAKAVFARFHPRWGRSYLLRNHQKIIIADKQRAIVGGANIETCYFVDTPPGALWHDLYIQIEGPAVTRLTRYFDLLERWMTADRPKMRILIAILSRKSDNEGPIRWLFGGPFRRLSPLTRALKLDIQKARVVRLIQAYFSPNWGMLRRLARAGRRWDVQLITAARSDNNTTIAAARHCYRRLFRGGVSVYEYQPQRLHMKLVITDDVVYIGSANFDMRSLFLNLEVMIRIEDPSFAKQMRDFVAAQVPDCNAIDPQTHEATSGIVTRLHRLLAYFLVSTVDFTVTRRNLRRL
jgi:cardiolipin synthase A/B